MYMIVNRSTYTSQLAMVILMLLLCFYLVGPQVRTLTKNYFSPEY